MNSVIFFKKILVCYLCELVYVPPQLFLLFKHIVIINIQT